MGPKTTPHRNSHPDGSPPASRYSSALKYQLPAFHVCSKSSSGTAPRAVSPERKYWMPRSPFSAPALSDGTCEEKKTTTRSAEAVRAATRPRPRGGPTAGAATGGGSVMMRAMSRGS